MQKDFQKWHVLKSQINDIKKRRYFREREIWWCHLGCNVGSEEDGKNNVFSRPILVIKKISRDLCWTLPLTSTDRRGWFYYPVDIAGANHPSFVILSQLRILDGRRLSRRIAKIHPADMRMIKAKIGKILGL
jgi:mRNA-degrading endonuclease toxin of MazEF toxin-antitoxin module